MGDGEAAPGSTDGEPVMGSLELDERDLRPALVEITSFYRVRRSLTLIVALAQIPLIGLSTLPWVESVPPLIWVIVFLAFLWVGPRLSARRLLRAVAKGGDTRELFRFDDDSVTIRSAGKTMTAAYRSLVDYREGATAFLLYTSPTVASIIPIRAFAPADLARVRQLLAANVKVRRVARTNRLLVLWIAVFFALLTFWQLAEVTGTLPRA